ncbi:abortive infection system antitoxin AbiGi family protein [Porphyromonas gulae]|uniref:Terminase n=1 Tax=Porphyromonas gulae TaxID=111105 RepID=A0A0A2FA88_9PORP|nr:abortive infection system antitoxin AbiGi family protein [Porphyromonas gulae]KGN87017.1 terminase [Porphyromonas gulae]
MSNRPDISNFLAHFTSDGKPKGGEDDKNPAKSLTSMPAKERLISILIEKKIRASQMPWTGALAVCFTECPWMSLLEHTKSYSPYGIGFKKRLIFSKHGAPALYMRTDVFREHMQEVRKFHKHVWSLITPFSPEYRPTHMKKAQYDIGTCDYAHEREWRVPHDFPFEYKDIEFVILNNYQDMAEFPRELKDAIGREKFILMDNYRLIERLWPVHRIDD